MEKLLRIENDNEVYYFTTYVNASKYIGCSVNAVRAAESGFLKKVKGYAVCWVEDTGDIFSKYINPYSTAESELKEEISTVEKAIEIMK